MAASLPLPSPPFVNVPGTANFRDAGDGKTMRYGFIYRSADPSKATTDGLVKMNRSLGAYGLSRLPQSTPSRDRHLLFEMMMMMNTQLTTLTSSQAFNTSSTFAPPLKFNAMAPSGKACKSTLLTRTPSMA